MADNNTLMLRPFVQLLSSIEKANPAFHIKHACDHLLVSVNDFVNVVCLSNAMSMGSGKNTPGYI